MEPKQYPHVFYNSTWGGYVMLLFGVCLAVIPVYGAANNRGNELSILFFFSFGALIIWLGWRNINDRKPALQLGPHEIWTPKLGALAWEEVHLKFEVVSAYKSGSIEYLMISNRRTRKHLESIPLTSLKGSVREIKELLLHHWKN